MRLFASTHTLNVPLIWTTIHTTCQSCSAHDGCNSLRWRIYTYIPACIHTCIYMHSYTYVHILHTHAYEHVSHTCVSCAYAYVHGLYTYTRLRTCPHTHVQCSKTMEQITSACRRGRVDGIIQVCMYVRLHTYIPNATQ
jgi:hypothetical protein